MFEGRLDNFKTVFSFDLPLPSPTRENPFLGKGRDAVSNTAHGTSQSVLALLLGNCLRRLSPAAEGPGRVKYHVSL